MYYSLKLKTDRESQSKLELAAQSLTSGAKLGQILKVQKDLQENSSQLVLGGRGGDSRALWDIRVPDGRAKCP